MNATAHSFYIVDQANRAGDWDVVVERQETEGEAALDAAAGRGDATGVELERHLRRGAPADEILEFVAAADIDVIVIGTHGRSGIDRIRHADSTLFSPLSATESSITGQAIVMSTVGFREVPSATTTDSETKTQVYPGHRSAPVAGSGAMGSERSRHPESVLRLRGRHVV